MVNVILTIVLLVGVGIVFFPLLIVILLIMAYRVIVNSNEIDGKNLNETIHSKQQGIYSNDTIEKSR